MFPKLKSYNEIKPNLPFSCIAKQLMNQCKRTPQEVERFENKNLNGTASFLALNRFHARVPNLPHGELRTGHQQLHRGRQEHLGRLGGAQEQARYRRGAAAEVQAAGQENALQAGYPGPPPVRLPDQKAPLGLALSATAQRSLLKIGTLNLCSSLNYFKFPL